jgi:hypothetical protein
MARYEKLPADLRKIIDDTTGVEISLKAARVIQDQSDAALAIARKDKEVISLSADEQKRWSAAFKALTAAQVSAIEKTGAPARAFAKAYGLNV